MKLDNHIVEIVFENAADSVVVTDIEGVIKFVNRAFTSITGYSYEDAVGQTPRILKSGHHDPDFYENLWKSILEGSKIKVLFLNKKKSGELYYHEEIITPVKQNGKVTGFVSCGRDVTELIESRNELEEYVKFIDTVFETMASQMAAFKLIKDTRKK